MAEEIMELELGEIAKEIEGWGDCSFEQIVRKAAIRGYLKGLEEEEFPMEILPGNYADLLENKKYEIPDEVWDEVNLMNCNRQAKVAYPICEEVHLARALNAIRIGDGPLGILKGREHLALPLELAGKWHFIQMTKSLHPLFKQFGLDKGTTQDKTNDGIYYPSMVNLFLRRRKAMFEYYKLDNYDAMYRFVASASSRVKGWPEELSAPFYANWELCLDAINQIAVHYF